MKISVKVTVHNAEKYLRECLDSAISQTFPDIEILCMDGGSMDSSPEILRDYAERDGRIRIINDPNTSYGHKVYEGIRLARGEYISVLESDDMYRTDMLEKLYRIAGQYRPDFVDADYLEYFHVAGERFYRPVRMYREEDYGHVIKNGKHPEDMRQILRYWTGLFKRDFLLREQIRMNESPGASFQDLSFRFLTSALAATSYHINEPVYLYRSDNPDSSVHNPEKAVATADEYSYLKGELEKRNIMNPYIWRHFYTWKYYDLYANMIRFQGEAREALFRRSYYELETDREHLEKNNYQEYSDAISVFINKTKQEIVADVEDRHQNLCQYNIRRRAVYERIAGYPLIIFGCGEWRKKALDFLCLRGDKILCYTDNAEALWNTELDGKIILSPDRAVGENPDALFVVANKLYGDDIVMQLRRMGVPDEMIYKFG